MKMEEEVEIEEKPKSGHSASTSCAEASTPLEGEMGAMENWLDPRQWRIEDFPTGGISPSNV